jgi:hypothetical protein
MKVESLKDKLMDRFGYLLQNSLWYSPLRVSLRDSLLDPLRDPLADSLWNSLWVPLRDSLRDTIDRQARTGRDEG